LNSAILPARVAIALGSNLGDREAHLAFARARLASIIDALVVSRADSTEPVDVPDAQGLFLNAAATGTTTLPPEALLQALQAIEDDRGRERPFTHASRTLDLDLILYGDAVVSTPALTLPHPRFRERWFVLQPLADIAPGLEDPVTGLTMAQLLERLPPASSGPRR
jgi:2-amino-4-hydroxy-6-hydroxymethyldihydropteridine diphosphokinase